MAITILGPLSLGSGTPASADTSPTVSMSPVSATFYPNPNNMGAFDILQLSSPVSTQTFPLIAFNPPSVAQVACSNDTGVDENTRPFTDVIPNPDGTCSTEVATGDVGVGPLFEFEASFVTDLTVATPGNVTFNFYSDDGWNLGIGPQVGGSAQPTTVPGGEDQNPLPASAVNSYPIVGALNGPNGASQDQATVNFPAAGTYPTEIDYTECCGGQLALTLGTTEGTPILPGASTTPGEGGCVAPLTAPTQLSVAPGEESATVSWAPATSNPPGCIEEYVITPSPSGIPAHSLGQWTTTLVPGLADGTTVTFTVAAANGDGIGPQSAPTSPITIGAPPAPSATSATRIAYDTLKVDFAAPADNGSPITSYKAVCRSANGGTTRGRIGPTSPLGVKNLTKGKKYACTVTATNGWGNSQASAPSSLVKG